MSARGVATTVRAGEGARFDLRAGERIVISTPDGCQGGDFSFGGFDQAMTRNVNGWARFGRPWLVYFADRGMSLCDGNGEPVMEVGECRGEGRNDIMYPGCWRELYEDRRPGCRDLISAALGVERRELTGMLSFFCAATPGPDAYRGLEEVRIERGDYVSFRALRDVEAAVSACPDTGIPGWRAGDLDVTVEGN